MEDLKKEITGADTIVKTWEDISWDVTNNKTQEINGESGWDKPEIDEI